MTHDSIKEQFENKQYFYTSRNIFIRKIIPSPIIELQFSYARYSFKKYTPTYSYIANKYKGDSKIEGLVPSQIV